MDSFSKCVFVRAGKHTSVHDVHPHSNVYDPLTTRCAVACMLATKTRCPVVCILATRPRCAIVCIGNMYKVIDVLGCVFFTVHAYKYI